MKTVWACMFAILLTCGLSLPAVAGNCGYVVNGDFEYTNTDNFYTDYTYMTPDADHWLWNPGLITIMDNPINAHGYWPDFTYDGNMLIVNGHTGSNKIIWKQSFYLTPNTNYVLSFELANVSYLSPARIYVTVDPAGTEYGPFTIQETSEEEFVPKFHRFELFINSGTTGSFDITFIDSNTAHSGNDFAMDNICLTDIPLSVDIKPGSCPNPFNLKQKGVVPVAILGSDILEVSQLDPESVRLCLENGEACIEPIRVELVDAGIPCMDCEDCNCTAYSQSCDEEGVCGYDGILDLNLKFNSTELAAMLRDAGHAPGDIVPLTIKANYPIHDPDPVVLEGQDCIVIVNQ